MWLVGWVKRCLRVLGNHSFSTACPHETLASIWRVLLQNPIKSAPIIGRNNAWAMNVKTQILKEFWNVILSFESGGLLPASNV